MDTADIALLQEIRPSELGDRLRAARLAKGWTQTDLASGVVSVGYVSRLESGQRRPNAEVLESLATRLEIPVDQLLRGPTAREHDAIRLDLDFAELALENGDHDGASARAREARDRAVAGSMNDLVVRARYLLARAFEGQGEVDDAVLELEPVVAAGDGGILRVRAAIALSRCYRESGDLGLAIETALTVLDQLAGTPLDSADEAVQLAVTLAAAYYERGDTGQAVRTCRKAIAKAEKLGSTQARASAYWNASIMESERGSVMEAIPLAERALALLTEGQDGRNVARLRIELANLQLQLDPPEIDAAQDQLAKAESELRESSAGAVDIARNDLGHARALLYAGDYTAARVFTAAVHDSVRDHAPRMAAEAKSLEGQAAAATGHLEEATQAYRDAVMILTGVGADRSAAELWFELADLLEGVGDHEAALTAYRSAAASVGLRARPAVPAAASPAIPALPAIPVAHAIP